MRLFTIKLPEEMYWDLFYYAKAYNTTMSEVVRSKIHYTIKAEQKKSNKRKEKRGVNFFDATEDLKVAGDQFKGFTNKEILYGKEITPKGKKIWKKISW